MSGTSLDNQSDDAETNPMDEMPKDHMVVDPRFQNINATRYCYTHYVDYHRCQYILGKKDQDCNIFQTIYQRICPNAWINRWDEQKKKGIFPRNCETELD